MRDPRYDILFETVQIGPVKTRNRFYQVPHCTGMGHRYPRGDARLRAIKAEGGWGVVSTQETEIHASADITPSNQARLWDDNDIPALQLMTESVHEHGSLAAIQLVHGGQYVANRYSRQPPIGPSHGSVICDDPMQVKPMDKSDIREFRQWHKDAAQRAKRAGFDIVYVYAGHNMTLLQHFLLSRYNTRTDDYGGSFENRLRLLREVIADTKDAVGDTCAVAVRLTVDELLGEAGLSHETEGRDIIEALAEEPDLWDVNLSGWANDSQTSRYSDEGFQEPYTAFVKSVTTKPVVGVGRYTSPDTMARVIRKGQLDLIGAARPSIADPFLPQKIEQGRIEEIRECIGCNICVASDNLNMPIRCTQNPTMGEEWRRDWHPEIIPRLSDPEPHLIVGGGPAGLEAALVLARRGADVIVADAALEWGGRVARESRLPGLAVWGRVRDWRLWQLQQMSNVELYLESPLGAEDILEYGIPNVVLATGASWRKDGVGRHHPQPLAFLDCGNVMTPDDLMSNGVTALSRDGSVVIFDDDRYYMASVLAEQIAKAGFSVQFVTPEPVASPWSVNTLEQERTQKRLLELGVGIVPLHGLTDLQDGVLEIACVYTGQTRQLDCTTLVSVTSRLPNDRLWQDLSANKSNWQDAGIQSVTRIGDCLAPGIIASAVFSGHQFARAAGESTEPEMKREDFTQI